MFRKPHILNRALNTIFPETCPVCLEGRPDHATAPICAACWKAVIPYKGPSCLICGLPLDGDSSTTCAECIKDRPAFRSAISFGLYKGTLKKAVSLLKYHKMKRLSKPLAEMLLRMEIPHVDAVLPVPLYREKLRQREFNQSALIAKYTAKGIGRILVTDCLIKAKETMPQVGLNSVKRRRNVRNAFVTQSSKIEGKDILLIDDVITTGATIRECSRVLKKAGAGNIYVMALARAKD